MRCVHGRINQILQAGTALLLLVAAGCSSTEAGSPKKPKKDMAQVRVYREALDVQGRAAETGSLGASTAKIGRKDPVEIGVLKEPFLDERDVKRAQVVEQADGTFMLALEFTQHGTLVLQMNSLAVQGQRLAVAARWSDGSNVVARFIAAPVVRRQLDKGVLVFTPDLDRDEAKHFVQGLNNVAIKLENQPKPKDEEKERKKAEKEAKKKAKEEKSKPSSKFKNDFDPFLPQPQ